MCAYRHVCGFVCVSSPAVVLSPGIHKRSYLHLCKSKPGHWSPSELQFTWLSSLPITPSPVNFKTKDNTSMFPTGLPQEAQRVKAGQPAFLTLPPLVLPSSSSWRWGFRAGAAGPQGGLPPGGCVRTQFGAIWRGHKPLRNGPGWGFVSPRHLGHGFLRNKSKTFLLPGPERRPLVLSLNQADAPEREQGRTYPLTAKPPPKSGSWP